MIMKRLASCQPQRDAGLPDPTVFQPCTRRCRTWDLGLRPPRVARWPSARMGGSRDIKRGLSPRGVSRTSTAATAQQHPHNHYSALAKQQSSQSQYNRPSNARKAHHPKLFVRTRIAASERDSRSISDPGRANHLGLETEQKRPTMCQYRNVRYTGCGHMYGTEFATPCGYAPNCPRRVVMGIVNKAGVCPECLYDSPGQSSTSSRGHGSSGRRTAPPKRK